MQKHRHFSFHELLHFITDRLHLNENTVILLLAAVVGIIGGFGAIGFRELIGLIQTIALGNHENILVTVSALPWYKKLLLPVIGGLVVGPLIYYFGKETRGHGVPEVMEAVALRGGKIRSRVMFLKAFVSAVTIGTGGSVGREGPIVQIGSSLGSTLGQLLKVSRQRQKILVACGAAAGIAATFNAPLAGVLFSVEIILGNYAILTLMPLILSSVLATIVGRWYFGNVPAFEIPHYSLVSAWEIGPYIVLGIASGVVALAFIKVLYSLEDLADKIPLKDWIKTPIIFSLIGFMVIFFPHIYGVGYDTITPVLKGEIIWYMLLLLVPIKMLATSISLAAGGSGGIFAPSLFIGAVFGGFFGTIMHFLFPEVVLNSGAYAVVGMSAVVAGATHAPITAFLVIFEMTGDYKLILPLMIGSILASAVASSRLKDSIYTMKLSRRGVDVSRGMEVSIMQATMVSDVMRQSMVVLHQATGFHDLLQKVIKANEACYYVVDDDKSYQGSFSIHDVKEIINEQSLAGLVVAKDLVSLTISPYILESATLAQCMRKFSMYDVEELPVVENETSMKLVGKVSRRDIITIYDREILRQGTLGLKYIQSKLPEKLPQQSYVDLPDGFEINLFTISGPLEGKTLQELDVRHKYGVTVIAINRRGERGEREVIIPEPNSVLKRGYILVVIGKISDLKKFKKLFHLMS
ncbi:chloride channel protein [candidate division CSSED10-310 bacterium]|uniref:Chloride channel protein n=1 Tax=candidate division CSSED10-310 bacterium TaxID=2855610 RepID=A0ABV6Z220_UNCC1